MLPADAPAVLELIRAEFDLVEVVASRVARVLGNVVEREDLVSAGREGLLDAARRFDPSRGVSFRTYAGLRVEGAMFDAARQVAGLPRRTYERLAALRAVGLLSEGRLEPIPVGLGPSDEDLEAALSDQALAFVTAAAVGAELAGEHDAARSHGLAEDAPACGYSATDPEQALMRAELLALIREGIERLPPDEKLVLEKVYYENQTLLAVARQLDCGKSWTTRLHARGMQRLSQRLKPRTP